MFAAVEDTIATAPTPTCFLCGTPGEYLYRNLSDRLFGAPGIWHIKHCPGCGLAWLDPMPSKENIGTAYKNYFTHQNPADRPDARNHNVLKQAYQFVQDGYLAQKFGYATAGSSWQRYLGLLLYVLPFHRASLEQRVMGLRAQPGGRLLDVGCGNGDFLAWMRSLNWQVEGVEVDPKAVENARAQGLNTRLGSLEDQNYPENHFDALTLFHVIEHVHDPLSLLAECHRVLKPGGRLVVSTPNTGSWGHRIFRENWRGLEPPRHLFLFSRRAMGSLLRKAGFHPSLLRTSAVLAPSIYWTSSEISRQGRHDRAAPLPFTAKIKVRCFAMLEHCKIKLDAEAGEELVLIAQK